MRRASTLSNAPPISPVSPLESKEGPPSPVFSWPTVITWPDIGTGTMKGIITIDPARDRPAAVLITMPVLLAYDLDVHHVVFGVRDGACLDQRHCRGARGKHCDRRYKQ